ncbi:ABC transporter ATP-binding protein [Ensifer sp. 4252]|uniref:ABC transporter ATP-binding protein n=1 Tax=Ensifer sp. 4252 TaxID=3373915 RepID=UPI003D1DA35A
MSTRKQLLSVRNLGLSVAPGVDILKDVSFDVKAGEIVALVGESGSGKTMAAKACLQLLPEGIRASAGHIHFDGKDILSLSGSEMRKIRGAQIGMIFQEPMVSLNPNMSIGDQLAEGLILHEKVSVAEARSRAVEMLRRVQIKDPESCLAAFPHQFSGGMRQRIMIASVMLLKPKLVIADEPTTALDTLTQREVLDVMVDLTRSQGTAVLLITHNLGLVAKYAQRMVVLERGRLVETGPVDQVLRRPSENYTRSLIEALPKRHKRGLTLSGTEPLIEARDLAVTFAGPGNMFSRSEMKKAVKGVSLMVRPGEAVAIVGGSGSGKTTLGRALIGLIPHSEGEVAFRGVSMKNADRRHQRDFRLSCQLVFQDPYSSLNPRQKVSSIVAEPLRHERGLTRAQTEKRVRDTLEEVGLGNHGDRFPHALSGGQRQRVAIARAVIRNPAFVVADEPVSALDMTIQRQVLDLFRRLQARHGFACVFISHDLAAVSSVADRIVVMKDGLIVEEGTVDDILDRPMHPYTRALLDASPTLEIAA